MMPIHLCFKQSPRQTVAGMSPETWEAWRARYVSGDGAELRAIALLERAEVILQDAGETVTVHALWIMLADRAATENNADLRAAAGLAGMAMGL